MENICYTITSCMLICISALLSYFPCGVQGIIVNNREVKSDLTLYDGQNATGNSLLYSEHIGWFDDLEYMMSEAGMAGLAWICVQSGVFIFYKERGYFVNSADEVRLMSGINVCALPPPSGVGSLRHAASKWFSTESTNHVTLFSELYYGGLLYTVLNKSQRDMQRIQPTQSMIIVGSDQWMVQNQAGDTYCISPYNSEAQTDAETEGPANDKRIYVCLIPNTTNIFDKGNGQSDIYITKVTKQCSTAGSNVISVQIKTCFDYKSGELQQPAIDEIVEPVVEENKTLTTDPGDESSPFYGLECGTYDELATLIRMRVTNDFVDVYQFLLPLDKQHTWRTELIDATFEVVTKLVGSIIPAWFLGSVREFFVYFSEKNVWSNGKGWPVDKPTKDVEVAVYETKRCLELAGAWDLLRDILAAVDGIIKRGPINETDIIQPALIKKMVYDPLMEFVWLSINLVGITCHQILGFETNFWLDYLTIANNMYLKPMVDYWLDSADEQKYYPLIFGGLNFTRQYQKQAVFATSVYDLVKYSEILPRPEELKTGRSSHDHVTAAIEGGDIGGVAGPIPGFPTTAEEGGFDTFSRRRKRQQEKEKTL